MPRIEKKKFLRSQARELVSIVYDFMKKEATEKHVEKLTDARWRTSQATGVSESTITRILREKRMNPSGFTSPLKYRKVKARKIVIEEFDVGVIRRTIQDFQKEFNETPSVMNLKSILKDRIQFDASRNTLRTLLLKLGYRFRKTETKKTLLIEKQDVQWARLNYLQQIKAFRKLGRPIVYTDESYIYINHDQNKSLVKKDSNTEGVSQSTKGPRLIMVHAGSSSGFIPNALLIYNTEAKTGDYKDDMNADSYLKWLQTQLIPNLPKNAVVVMDDAPYHNSVLEKIPTLNSTKKEMQAWLAAKKIAYDEDFLKVELYDLVKKNRDKFRSYKVDELLKEHNFTVLRLPPYHSELNPIGNIWDIVRNYVVSQTEKQKGSPMLETLNEAFNEVKSNWNSACRHVENIEEDYLKFFELEFNFVVTDSSESDSEDDDSELSDADDSDSDADMA